MIGSAEADADRVVLVLLQVLGREVVDVATTVHAHLRTRVGVADALGDVLGCRVGDDVGNVPQGDRDVQIGPRRIVLPGKQLLASSTLIGTTFPYFAIFRSLFLIGALKLGA